MKRVTLMLVNAHTPLLLFFNVLCNFRDATFIIIKDMSAYMHLLRKSGYKPGLKIILKSL